MLVQYTPATADLSIKRNSLEHQTGHAITVSVEKVIRPFKKPNKRQILYDNMVNTIA